MNTPELLAPAGDREALLAALDAGADAVYLGLRQMNARRLARNFDPQGLAEAVELAHSRGSRVYLTLNTDLTEREVGMAARVLQIAEECGVDAVLVRDPALLALREAFPNLSFHFSTQTAVTSSADVRAAAELQIDRVVLAREMALDEIHAAGQVPGVQTEVFVQGALCFSVSGRCQLSSWLGGRSGNRGLCASPCRIPWSTSAGHREGALPSRGGATPFSMRDLAAAEHVDALAQASVAALKIEGRMKNADWVRRAVSLYRALLDRQPVVTLTETIRELGAYSGRECTAGYLEGDRTELTGTFGRPARVKSDESSSDAASSTGMTAETALATDSESPLDDDDGDRTAGFEVDVQITADGIECECRYAGRAERWRLPRTVVRRAHKAVSLESLAERWNNSVIHGVRAGHVTINEPGYLLVPRAANDLLDRVAAVVHRALKHRDDLPELELPEPIRAVLARGTPSYRNQHSLGIPPDRVRLEARQLQDFLRQEHPDAIIVEEAQAGNLRALRKLARRVPLIVALPAVFFEKEIVRIDRLLAVCEELQLPVEVNNWGGWWLARQRNLTLEAGPGLGVLNSLAGRLLAELGMTNVTVSTEADRRQMEALTDSLPVACSIVVFGRPALLTTRVELADESVSGQSFSDRRQTRIRGRREDDLWVFRPVEPFDLRGLRNPRIRAAHYVIDLVGADDPVSDYHIQKTRGDAPFRFNYSRTLH